MKIMIKQKGAVQPHQTNFSFTDRRLNLLKKIETGTPTNQTEYSDIGCVGLKLIHSHLTDRKMFHHRYSLPNGKKKTLKIGEHPAVTVELARKITNLNKALLAEGVDPTQQRKELAERLTFREFVEQIYLPYAMARKKSWKDDKNKLEKDMYRAFGKKLLTEITLRDTTTYINAILKRTSKSTANRHRALLSSIFNTAINHEMLEKNHIEHIEKFPESTDHGRCLMPDELQKLLSALDTARNPVSALAVKLLLATGMRKSECLQLKWCNIDLIGRFAKLNEEETKGKQAHIVILNDSALTILKDLENHKKPENPHVFPGENNNHLTTVRKTFENCKSVSGIKDFRLHDCRHTFCSILAKAGVSQYMIQQLIGHRSPAMTQRYSHLSAATMQEASQIVSKMLDLAGSH